MHILFHNLSKCLALICEVHRLPCTICLYAVNNTCYSYKEYEKIKERQKQYAPPVPYIIFLYILIDVKEIRDNYKVQISGKCIQAEYYSCRYKYHLTRIANSHKAYKCQIPYHSWKRKCVVIKKSLYAYIAEYILYLKGLVHKHLGYFKASSLPSLSLCVQFVHILYWVNKEYRIFAHFDSFILPVFHLECDMCILTYCICVIHPRL